MLYERKTGNKALISDKKASSSELVNDNKLLYNVNSKNQDFSTKIHLTKNLILAVTDCIARRKTD